MTTVRAFIAIPLPGPTLDAIGGVQRRLARQVPERCVRWVRPEGIHLTLKFLGDTPTGKLPGIEAALAAVARNAPAFSFGVRGMGCFPNPRRPRVVWIGLEEPSGRLERLQQATEEAMDAAGFPPDSRRFRPHLTLGRISRRASRTDAARVGEVVLGVGGEALGEAVADSIALIRSVLKPTGADYTTLATFRLREPSQGGVE